MKALCAIVVPSSIASTQWSKEKERMKRVLQNVMDQKNASMTEENLEEVSQAAVKYIVYSSLTETNNAEQIEEHLGSGRKGIFPFPVSALTQVSCRGC
jgi:hypothetical protein